MEAEKEVPGDNSVLQVEIIILGGKYKTNIVDTKNAFQDYAFNEPFAAVYLPDMQYNFVYDEFLIK